PFALIRVETLRQEPSHILGIWLSRQHNPGSFASQTRPRNRANHRPKRSLLPGGMVSAVTEVFVSLTDNQTTLRFPIWSLDHVLVWEAKWKARFWFSALHPAAPRGSPRAVAGAGLESVSATDRLPRWRV